jgi:hypothetical protein
MIRNKNQFLVNSEIYHFDTRQHANFHQPSVNVTNSQKGVSNVDTKVFNMLPSYIKVEIYLGPTKVLHEHSFYSLDEYFKFQKAKGK